MPDSSDAPVIGKNRISKPTSGRDKKRFLIFPIAEIYPATCPRATRARDIFPFSTQAARLKSIAPQADSRAGRKGAPSSDFGRDGRPWSVLEIPR
jgi:hypothetical protein